MKCSLMRAKSKLGMERKKGEKEESGHVVGRLGWEIDPSIFVEKVSQTCQQR